LLIWVRDAGHLHFALRFYWPDDRCAWVYGYAFKAFNTLGGKLMAPQTSGFFESPDQLVQARLSYEQTLGKYVLSIDEFNASQVYSGSIRVELDYAGNAYSGRVTESTEPSISIGNTVTANTTSIAGSETIQIAINTSTTIRNFSLPKSPKLFRTLKIFHDKESSLYLAQPIAQLQAIDLRANRHTLETVFSSASIKIEYGSPQPALPAGNDAIWTAAELLAALKIRMPALRSPWSIWVFEGTKYEDDAVHGILIKGDKNLKESRKGCAVFSGSIEGVEPERNRKRLWTIVHEIGHCLNLVHTSRRLGAQPSCFLTDAAAVTDSFWQQFQFKFNDDSLIDLHHSSYPTICPGESEFKDAQFMAKTFARGKSSGLQFEISAEAEVTLNEPLLLQLKISNIGKRTRHFKNYLNPRWGHCEIAISNKNWETQYYPIIDHCGSPVNTSLSPRDKVRDFVWLHSNGNGLLFPKPGIYTITAAVKLTEKAWLHSNPIQVRVIKAQNKLEDFLSSRFDPETIRMLFEVQGSDCESMSSSMNMLKEIASDESAHRTARKCASILAINSCRDFKSLKNDSMQIRYATRTESSHWFAKAVKNPTEDELLFKFSNIALNNYANKLQSEEAEDLKRNVLRLEK
jgi:hypothetical protein